MDRYIIKKFHTLSLLFIDEKDDDDDDDASNNKKKSSLVHRVYDLPKMLGSFGLLKNVPYDYLSSEKPSIPVLCAWEDGFQLYDIGQQKVLSDMSIGECVNPIGLPSRLNDGRTDPIGKYYICGGYHGSLDGIKMKVFKCEQNEQRQLQHTMIVPSITTTNSICWSIDG